MRASTLLPAVLAATATAVNLYATSYSGTVDTLTLSGSAGGYSLRHSSSITSCGSMPSWLTLDSAGLLYCSNEANTPNGTLSTFTADATGKLTQKVSAKTYGGDVASVFYGGSKGSFIAIAHYETSAVSTHALPLKSNSKPLQTFIYTLSAPGPNPSRQDAPHPHEVVTDPTGRFILSPDLGADVVRVYSINATTGILTPQASLHAPAGSGPRHVAFYTCSKSTLMYLTSELADTVTAYSIDYPSSGGMSFVRADGPIHPFPRGVNAPGGAVAEVHVKGQTLTVSNRNDTSFGPLTDSIAVFNIANGGSITFQDIYSAGGSYPRTFVINKAGDLIAIGDQNTDSVVVMTRDVSTGKIGHTVGNVTLGGQVSSVVWSE